ncbi:MAG: glycosyltransferase [Eubacteriales bacterium]|jgi:glycosyltransferase involved in cell wall biosynthesis|nr:glycosyltransferase [Eubacteriales bacterium]
MKIGQFSDTFLPIVDGVGRVVYNYATALSRRGESCYVIAPMADTGFRGGYPFELVDYISSELPSHPQYNTGIPQLDQHYDARMRDIPLDIIHAHAPFIAGLEAQRLARRRDIPIVGMFHSRYYDDFYQITGTEMLANIAVATIVNFYQRCDEVWTVSQSSKETLYDYGYVGEVIVMPNGTPDIDPDPARAAAAKAKYNLPDEPILLYCGQINWKKNILRILESCALYARSGKPFTLVLAGQGPDVKSIQQKTDELGLSERVRFTGHITGENDLYGLYENADLFVFPSLYDTSGMVVREAAAMGTPSVVVRGCATAEPILDRENGFLCEDTTQSLCDVIDLALSDSAMTSKIGQSARKTIYLSWDEIATASVERYAALIERKKKISKKP